jgi:hypothetical protein
MVRVATNGSQTQHYSTAPRRYESAVLGRGQGVAEIIARYVGCRSGVGWSALLVLAYCFGWLKRIMFPDGSRKAQSTTP